MRKFFLAALALVALAGCTKSSDKSTDNAAETSQECELAYSEGQAMLDSLNNNQLSLIVRNDGVTTSYSSQGVEDLLYLFRNEPERLKGAVVADKMVGKAAAALLIAGGVKEVHTNFITTPALEMLKQADIHGTTYDEVPMILNRDGSGQCPIESLLNDAQTAEECVEILMNRFPADN
jgi:iron complex outermembrane receptor protein